MRVFSPHEDFYMFRLGRLNCVSSRKWNTLSMSLFFAILGIVPLRRYQSIPNRIATYREKLISVFGFKKSRKQVRKFNNTAEEKRRLISTPIRLPNSAIGIITTAVL